MEIKKSIVKNVQGNGTWDSSFGLMYKFDIEMENGDMGTYLSKSKDQNKFIVGQEREYEYTGGDNPRIKPHYDSPYTPQTTQKPAQQTYVSSSVVPKDRIISNQSSMNRSMEYHCCKYKNGNISIDLKEILKDAEIISDWVLNYNGKHKEEPIQQPKKEDDLPF